MGSVSLRSLMGPGAWEFYRPAAPEPQKIRTLVCACCGESVKGRQWRNRDTGYGVCVRCADANTAKYGEGKPGDSLGGDTTYALYGVRGQHFAVDEDAVCVMDWDRCTEKFCDLYASGCPHFNEEG